ncbi:hypothetical protein ZTR_07439 [Talaromyces verruculosus]|nr:hypothetical protein ZTR_07439 [Talaromyces verruculosus]
MGTLICLPAELVGLIVSFLPNRDIKNLRLTCPTLGQMAQLRLGRVFLSANPLNIEVFRAIADHEEFRHNIVEIIWDDARLIEHAPERRLDLLDGEDWAQWGDDPNSYEGIPWWFEESYEENIKFRGAWKRIQETDPSIHDSWEFYQQILQQQKSVLDSDDDIKAFRYGLERFPRLRRVKITPIAHGVLDVPLYETPMIRSFLPKFNYPIPYTWPPYESNSQSSFQIQPWNQEEKMKWRGFCLITNELSKMPNHTVSEFVVDTHTLHMTGLSCRIFDQPCEEYTNLVSLFQRPGFSRIDLTLLADGQFSRDQRWSSFRSGLLKSALTVASSDLKHFNLQINVNYEKARHFNWPPDHPFDPEDFVPLKTILPTVSEKWKKLQHFGLSGLLVRGDELLGVLADLPTSIRSVELSHLEFLDRNPNAYHDLLVGIRDTLRWGEREVHKRPVLTVHHKGENSFNMLYSCYDKAVNDFVYHGGLDPFRRLIIHQPIPYRLINPFDTNSNPNAPLETLE